MAGLGGRVVAYLEARRAVQMGQLIRRHGGVPYPVPCLREIHRPDSPELQQAVKELCNDTIQVVVFLTGVGTATILEAARQGGIEQQLLSALKTKRIAVRGPKPLAVLHRHGIKVHLQAEEPNTTEELVRAMRHWDLQDKRVAVQLYDAPNPRLQQFLKQQGAEVIEIHPYKWDLPENPQPVLNFIEDAAQGKVDVLAATSAIQVDNLFTIASEHGQAGRLHQVLSDIPIAAQGPICASAFLHHNLSVSITPSHGHMGSLILAIARYFANHNPQEVHN